MNGLAGRSARDLRRLIAEGAASCEEVARDHLDRIAALDSTLGTLLTVDGEGAIRTARELDARLARGEEPPPLAGVPAVVKDNLCTRGLRTTCGSKILENYTPPYDATAIRKLREAGAVILGKANMDEFAMGSSTENSAFGPTRNPWDLSRVPGGSSGGCAAAVAAGMAPLALGSDTGGSVKQPAAFCGVVGMRPTYGRVSRYGLVAFASSLDQVGPITGTVEDNLLLLSAVAGADPRDATSADGPALRPPAPGDDLTGLRVGLVREHFSEGLDGEVASSVGAAARSLQEAGAEVREVSLPHSGQALATYTILATAEASSNLARFDGARYGPRREGGSAAASCEATRTAGFGPEVKRRILLGTFVLSEGYRDAFYARALRTRSVVAADFEAAFADADILLGPTTPSPAFPLGEKADDPLAMYLSDIYTVPANLVGLPGLSLPCGFTAGGLPVGAHLVGRRGDERTLYGAALFLERSLGLDRRPPL